VPTRRAGLVRNCSARVRRRPKPSLKVIQAAVSGRIWQILITRALGDRSHAGILRSRYQRRLERLEDLLIPDEEPTAIGVVFIDAATKLPTGGFQVNLGYTRPSEQSRRLARTTSDNVPYQRNRQSRDGSVTSLSRVKSCLKIRQRRSRSGSKARGRLDCALLPSHECVTRMRLENEIPALNSCT